MLEKEAAPAVPRVDASAPAVRDRLLTAATELFTRRGYAATSVREIVEGAGVAKPALYYHFGSKEGIYLAILSELKRTFEEAVERLSAGGGCARDRLDRLCFGLFELFEQNVAGLRFINASFWGPPQGAPRFDFEAMHRRLREALGNAVDAAITAGEIRARDADDVALVLMAVLTFSMDLHLVYPETEFGMAGLGRLLDLVYSGVHAPLPGSEEVLR